MEQFEQDLLNNGYELVNSFEYNPNPNELDVTNVFIIYKGKIDNIWVEVSWFKKQTLTMGQINIVYSLMMALICQLRQLLSRIIVSLRNL